MERRKEKRRRAMELARLQSEMRSIRSELGLAYMNFDRETDPSLTEARIYEISALRARYDHAFQELKRFF